MNKNDVFSIETNSVNCETFSEMYPLINNHLMNKGEGQQSRNGNTREVLNFKTEIRNPYNRCVGGFGRDMNIFFLLCEAMWIFTGKRDVETLSLFNSNMKQFSDDGKFFHAPYGFRLRNYGSSSFVYEGGSNHELQGIDQIEQAIKLLSNNSEDRRVVMSIWNPELDLNIKSVDLPCNDMVMFKIRNGKLYTTIQNRSNDLHWGLPTNVFQFSFLSEMISLCLGVELGNQVHNSQSLHFYIENQIAWELFQNNTLHERSYEDLYKNSISRKIDFKFENNNSLDKLKEVTSACNLILESLFVKNDEVYLLKQKSYDEQLISKSNYLYLVKKILHIYLDYCSDRTDIKRISSIIELSTIDKLGVYDKKTLDIVLMAKNFMYKRLSPILQKEENKFGETSFMGKF